MLELDAGGVEIDLRTLQDRLEHRGCFEKIGGMALLAGLDLDLPEIAARARRLKAEQGLALVVIDYLQLLQGGGRHENRQQEVTALSRALKVLAKELEVPVLAVSQLSRKPEERSRLQGPRALQQVVQEPHRPGPGEAARGEPARVAAAGGGGRGRCHGGPAFAAGPAPRP